MPVFESRFLVDAPPERVAAFHFSPGAFDRLSPPGMPVRIHRAEPLAEGSIADFSLWLGPWPTRWTARHHDLSPTGFTDVQIAGPMLSWSHRHQFLPHPSGGTLVTDAITYQHPKGPAGLLSRLRFNRLTLSLLFLWRAHATRKACSS